MLSKTFGSVVYGIDASTITVEVNVRQADIIFSLLKSFKLEEKYEWTIMSWQNNQRQL